MSSPARTPQCVGFIIDGNRRWAKARKKPTFQGHRAGYFKLRDCIRWAAAMGIPHLVFYVFSTENWKRAPKEVDYLFRLLRMVLRREIGGIKREKVRLRFIGFRDRISRQMAAQIADAEKETAKKDARITATLAFDYGGRSEIIMVTRALAAEVKNGTLQLDAISEENFAERLWSAGIPDPDIIVRTGGEQRLSNFLSWQSAYSEFFFTQTLWPDFSEKEFLSILSAYQKRERRFGV